MLSPLLFELFYETHVVFIEKSDVVDSVFEHGYTLNAHTESETGVLFGINSAYLENGGMCTMPQPRISIQPDPLHTLHPLPPHLKQDTSISAEGSVKGK